MSRRPRATLAALAGLAAVLALTAAGSAPAASQPPRASLPDIEDEVMCPICGTPLNLSQAPQAERERAFIRRLIARGETKAEIKAALVGEYGPEVLATPDDEGFDLAAWIVPGAGIMAVAVGLGLALRRWRRRAHSAAPPPAPLDPDERQRLDSDLARYDL